LQTGSKNKTTIIFWKRLLDNLSGQLKNKTR